MTSLEVSRTSNTGFVAATVFLGFLAFLDMHKAIVKTFSFLEVI